MTMMTITEPALLRLFARIDSLPRPKDDGLARLYKTWQTARSEQVAPGMASFRNRPLAYGSCEAFICLRSDREGREYRLVEGAEASRLLLGAVKDGSLFSEAPERRGAARLRRLFNWALRSGEPVLVEFRHRHADQGEFACELLALPLIDHEDTPTALLTGFHCRPLISQARPHLTLHPPNEPLFFSLRRDQPLARAIVRQLSATLSPLEERLFEDGESKVRPLVSVRGHPVVVFASLNGDAEQSVHDRLCRLLFLIAGMKTNGASRVTAVVPYLCYMRKDRQTKANDPLTARYVAQLFEAVGTDCLITLEVHNPSALENAFRCPVVHVEAYTAFANFIAERFSGAALTVVSPDLGAGKRVDSLVDVLQRRLGASIGKVIMDKQRSEGVVTGELFAGQIEGRTAVIFDDMISTGTTMLRAAEACRSRGATRIVLAASHGLFARDAADALAKDFITSVIVTNSVPATTTFAGLSVIDISRLLAEAVASVAIA